MFPFCRARLGTVFVAATLMLVGASAAHAQADAPAKLLFLKLHGSNGLAKTTAEDAVETQLNKAGPERGWELVSLGRVMGLEEKARACQKASCRQAIAQKLQATHVLYGTVRKEGWKTFVDLILEDSAGKIVRAKTVEGRAISLGEKVRVGVDQLLEETSPKEATARARLIQTADSYAKAGRTRDEVRTLQRAIQLNPFHNAAPALAARIANAWARAGDFEKAKDESERFVDMYGPLSAWAKTTDDASRAEAQALGRRAAIVTGTEAHRRARSLDTAMGETKDRQERATLEAQKKDLHKIAATAYTWIRRNWPQSKETPEATIYLADLRFDQRQWREAADLYREAQQDETRQDAATVGLVYAYERLMSAAHPNLAPAAPLPKLLPKAPTPLPPLAVQYVAAVDSLQRLAPRTPTRAAHEVSAGKLHLTLGHIKEGKRRLQFVADHFPKSNAGEVAATVLKNLKRVKGKKAAKKDADKSPPAATAATP